MPLLGAVGGASEYSWRGTLDDCVKNYTDDIEIEKIVTHEFDFEDIQKAFDIVADYKDEVLKCIITNN